MTTHTFYPFVEDNTALEVKFPTRIAVYDDLAAAPRVVIVDPCDIREYLEEITQTVSRLSHEQGGLIPFMVIREIVENLVHAFFIEPSISILPGGNTIRFSDQGPGIKEKMRALEYGTTSATTEMKRYIRGVGSGLPYAQQYLTDKGGSLSIEDNIHSGTVVTISIPDNKTAQNTYNPHHASEPPIKDAQPIFSHLSKRAQKILIYLQSHDSVGPKELITSFGFSASTWSRELHTLDEKGLTQKEKNGQKRFLTDAGKAILFN